MSLSASLMLTAVTPAQRGSVYSKSRSGLVIRKNLFAACTSSGIYHLVEDIRPPVLNPEHATWRVLVSLGRRTT